MSKFDFNIFSKPVREAVETFELKSGQTLFDIGCPVEAIYFCQSGCVRLVVTPQPNKELVLFRARDGEAFAEEHLSLERYEYRAVADRHSIVQSVPKHLILDDFHTKPAVVMKFFTCLAERYHDIRINFARLAIDSAKDRVFHLLTTMAVKTDGPIDLSGKIKSFSNDLNLSHEATYRALKELENECKIVRKDGQIVLSELSV